MTTLGEIPDSWHISTAEKFCLKVADGTHATPKPVLNGRYLVTSKHIKSGKVDLSSAYQISQDDFDEVNKRSKVDRWDVIFSMIGTVGEIALIDKDPGFAIKNVGLFKCGDEHKAKWLFYFLRGKIGQGEIQRRMNGTTQSYVTLGDLRSFPVIIPSSTDELKAIAAVLSSLDDKIELLREQNKTLEATAQAIFKEWFVNFNFPGATGKMIDSELGEIPEGWKVGTVNDVIERFSITYRCDQDDLSLKGKTPIFDQGTNGLYGYTERDADFQASAENPVILFTNHTCNMWFVNYPFCAIQNVIPFRGNAEYSTFFVFYMTLGKVKFIEYKGHWPDFEQKKHIIPKPEIANQFAEFVKPLQYKIWNNNSQVETLSKLRDTLLPKLMTGNVRVKGFED